MTPADLICLKCKNWNEYCECPAFPDGIPNEILSGENDHSKPLKEQKNNIVYEAVE